MNKRTRILLIALGVLVLGGGLFFWLRLAALKTPVRNALEAVPENAWCIISSRDPQQLLEKLRRGNLIWEELQSLHWSRNSTSIAIAADSLLKADTDLSGWLSGNTTWISLHHSAAGTEALVAVSLTAATAENDAVQLLQKAAGKTPLKETARGNARVLTHPQWTAAVCEGIVLISAQPALVNAAIEQLGRKHSLLNDAGFAAVLETAGKNVPANIYLHCARTGDVLATIANESTQPDIDLLQRTGGWMELDATLRPNLLLLNGYTNASDSAGHFLAAFEGQQPQRTEVQSVLPAGTLLFTSYALSNFSLWLDKFDAQQAKTGQANARREALDKLRSDFQFDAENDLGSWLGNEVALALLPNADGSTEPVALLSSSSTGMARENLARLSGEPATDTSGRRIHTLRAEGMLPAVFGPLFGSLRNCSYTVIQQYVVFARSPEVLQRMAAAAESGKTLARDPSYTDLASNLGEEATIAIYAAGGRCSDILRSKASAGFGDLLRANLLLLDKFDGVMLRFSATEQNLFFTSAQLRHNPQSKQTLSSLWETALDTTVSMRPQLLVNHNTQGLDVFVQDDANTIYLLSSTGKIFWKRNIGERILGEVQQVDALKNGKLQMCFATASALYVIDRNGNNLAPFPLKLAAKASSPVRVMDYDNDRNYRLLIACADKRVYNYTAKGEKVEGWKFAPAADVIQAPAQHCVVGGKDYIVFADRSGRVYVCDRQGNARINLREQMPAPLQAFTLEPGRDLAQTCLVAADTLGNVVRLALNGNLERLHINDFEGRPEFSYGDANGDGSREYLFTQGSRLQVFDQSKKLLLSQSFDGPLKGRAQVFSFGSGNVRIAVNSPQTAQLHLLHSTGTPTPGSPITGQTPCSIGRLNSTTAYTLVCGANGRYICAWPVNL
ncbi:MAG: DUF3352 domain-containing protein [Bacteroidia bacterium]|jgi:hypothetical protein|nr:DUF3352 domain-containing protein [Bacteroidia bacterium]